jgi:hypothetical protein
MKFCVERPEHIGNLTRQEVDVYVAAFPYSVSSIFLIFCGDIFTSLLTYLLIPWLRILFEKLIVTQLVKEYPAFFMEPEGSLPYSQKSTTRPYPEPAESTSPH